jgi:hypothetical protein
MTAPDDLHLRRIAVALGGGELPSTLIQLVQRNADETPELRGYFVEDSDLLKAAALPFTFEFCALTLRRRPLDAESVAAQLTREARAAAQVLATHALRAGCRWHFEVVRSERLAALRAALSHADAALVPAHYTDAAAPIIHALVDSGAAGLRAQQVAERLARRERMRLEIHPAEGAPASVTVARLAQWLRGTGGALVIVPVSLLECLSAEPDLWPERLATSLLVVA